ncbi:MAG: sigma-70 family RNA polymerase sigma factor [Deltaproteobacteria bacterium]|nr:sigma-70 family RNA polymerase sigma factor [Deltaproteobacteria bacterium]
MTETLPYRLTLEDAERDVVRRIRGGDADAYRLLVERHQARIHRLVGRFLGPDHGDVDDVVQDVFVKAFFSLSKFREDAAFGTWITRIAINRARDELKRQSGKVSLDTEPSEDAVDSLRDRLASDEQPDDGVNEAREAAVSGVVARTVAQLPDRLRVVVTLKDMEGNSYQEVARILDCSLGTVKSRHARGRARLRQMLTPHVAELFGGPRDGQGPGGQGGDS